MGRCSRPWAFPLQELSSREGKGAAWPNGHLALGARAFSASHSTFTHACMHRRASMSHAHALSTGHAHVCVMRSRELT